MPIMGITIAKEGDRNSKINACSECMGTGVQRGIYRAKTKEISIGALYGTTWAAITNKLRLGGSDECRFPFDRLLVFLRSLIWPPPWISYARGANY